MKIPITDKFLWELYNFLESLNKIYNFGAPRTMKEAIYPELFKFRQEWRRKKNHKNFAQFIYYLKKRGLIKIEKLKNKKAILLTSKGTKKALKIKYKKIEKERRKDGKWQMIIFDIPERKRDLRNLLRETLHLLGYKMLQQSVWVCPYDVFEETEGFIQRHSLDRYVKLFLIEEIKI